MVAVGRDDGVVVGHLGVVDDLAQRQLVEPDHEAGGVGVHRGGGAHASGDRLELGDHVAGQVARVGTRVGQHLVLVVQRLRGRQGPRRREPEAPVGLALQGRQVVEEGGLLGLRLGLEGLDDGGLVVDGLDDRIGRCGCRQAGGRALVPHADVPGAGRRRERRGDLPVVLGDERLDRQVAIGDQRKRRCLDAAERQHLAGRAGFGRRGAGGVHADQPVGLAACPCGLFEGDHLLVIAQVLERVADGPGGHRREPRPFDRLVVRLLGSGLQDELEDQLAFASGVAGVDDDIDVRGGHVLVQRLELLAGLGVTCLVLELLGHDRQVLVLPLLVALVVLVRVDLLHQVADREPDDGGRALVEVAVLGECAREGRAHVAGDGGLFADDE